MIQERKHNQIGTLLIAGMLLAGAEFAQAQTTNWIAYNDHFPSTTPVANGWRITAPNVTGYDMGAPADLAASPLTDFLTGSPLAATVSFTRTGGPDDFTTIGLPISTNTPMGRLFYGICDLSNVRLVGVRAVPPNAAESFVTATFGGLDPTKRYVFRGSVARNGGYGTRWSVAAISAEGWTDAHINGAGGPGVLTINSIPTPPLSAGEAAFNSGANNEGAVVGWNDVAPFPDGTFSITCKQYTGAIPGGTANGPYGYAFGALFLAEVEIVAPEITANPAATTTVEQNRPFSLNVTATGAPLNYQWYREDTGEILGATFATFSIAQAQVSDSGRYYAVVFNALGRQTSSVAQVTVFADTAVPAVETIFSYPSVDVNGIAALDQIIIEFNEPVDSASVSSANSYTVSGGVGNPLSVIVTNERSVVLVLGAPLAEDTDYSVTLSGATDAVGNVAGSSAAPFHSWVSGLGNGLLMESYTVEDTSALPESLLADSDYPNNPDRRDSIRAFDSRLVYPDDNREGYGARIRGVFIPPVSGGWRFFARTRNLGLVNINPNGLDEAGKVEILRQSTENPPFNWDRLQSSLVNLRAGQAYYIEGIYKGASGPDYLKVAARLAGTDVPMPVDSPDTDAPDANSLAGAIIAFPLAPRNLGGTLTIAQDVADRTVEENHPTTLSLQVNNPSGLPLHYQWFQNGTPVAGANLATYTVSPTLADSGATVSVQVGKVGSVIASRTATLTVIPDTNAPIVVAVRGSYLLDQLIVSFSEAVNPIAGQEPVSYTISPFSVLTAVIDATGTNVILTLDAPLAAGGTYPMTIFAQDLAMNGADRPATARAWVVSRGFALEQLYFAIGNGTAVTDLQADPKFPNSPDLVAWVPTLEGPTDTYDNYGTRLIGWIAPPIAGDYVFYMSSDDGGLFLLSQDENPVNVQPYAQETSFNAARTWTGDRAGGTRGTPPSNISPVVALLDGQLFAFEALAKEGGGGDNLGVAWRLPTDQADPVNGTPGIPGAFLYSLADPVGASVTITQQPANFVASALPATATFSVGASSTVQSAPSTLRSYIWQRDNGAGFADILGSYSSSYTVDVAQADVGARFRALVFGPGASATSAVATVSFGQAQPNISVSQSGGTITLSWPAGFRLQCATSLTPPVAWRDVDTGGANSYTVDPANQFDVNLDTAQSGGGARTGSGSGTVTLSGNTLIVDVVYSGLSSDRNNQHFHAPAPRGMTAGVAYDLGSITTGTRAGTVKGNVALAAGAYGGKSIAAQLQDLRASLWYLNIHTVAFGGGEIRGQVDPAGARFYRVVSP